jgi:hypothetical protein
MLRLAGADAAEPRGPGKLPQRCVDQFDRAVLGYRGGRQLSALQKTHRAALEYASGSNVPQALGR